MKKLITAASLVAASMAAHAQLYGEVGYTAFKSTASDYSEALDAKLDIEAKPRAIRAIVGYEFNENFALEGLVGIGLGDSDVDVKVDGKPFEDLPGLSNVKNTVKINNAVGLYLTPKVKLVDKLEGFLRLGVVHFNTEAESSATVMGRRISDSGSSSDTETSYGIGARFLIDPKFFISADYMVYGEDTKGFTIGIGYKF